MTTRERIASKPADQLVRLGADPGTSTRRAATTSATVDNRLGWDNRPNLGQLVATLIATAAPARPTCQSGPVAFLGCSLTETTFSRCTLSIAIFDGCRLTATVFDATDLRGADLRGNDLSAVVGIPSLRGSTIGEDQLPGITEAVIRDLTLTVKAD